VRYRCGTALVGLAERAAELNLPETVLYRAVRRELELDERVWKSHEVLSLEGEQESTLVDAVIRQRVHRSLEHVFNVLGVLLDRDLLKLSLHALFSDDDRLRGTALEYLENVLPHAVRERLWPYIGGGQKSTRSERSHDQIVEELFTSTDSLRIDLAKLRKQVTR
jgi:ATP:ADP antiporter, AAA family